MNKKIVSSYLLKALFVFSLAGILTACGGGGSAGGNTDENENSDNTNASPTSITIRGSVQDYPIPDAQIRVSNAQNQELAQTVSLSDASYELVLTSDQLSDTDTIYLEATNPTNGLIIRTALDVSGIFQADTVIEGAETVISHYSEAALIFAESGIDNIAGFVQSEVRLDETGRPDLTPNAKINGLASTIRGQFHGNIEGTASDYKVSLLKRYIEVQWPALLEANAIFSINLPTTGPLANVAVSIQSETVQSNVTLENNALNIVTTNAAEEGSLKLSISSGTTTDTLDLPVVVVSVDSVSSKTIVAGAADSVTSGDLVLEVPQGALLRDTSFSIRQLTPSSTASTDVLASYDVSTDVELNEPVTITYKLADGIPSGSVVLVHFDEITKQVEYVHASNFDAATSTISFKLESLSPIEIVRLPGNATYTFAGISTSAFVDDPVGAFGFVKNEIIDFLDDSDRINNLKYCDSLGRGSAYNTSDCAEYFIVLASKALTSFLQMNTDQTLMQQLENVSFRYQVWGFIPTSVFPLNGAEEYQRLRMQILSVLGRIQNGMQTGVESDDVNAYWQNVNGTGNAYDNVSFDIYGNPSTTGVANYWFPMMAYRLSKLGMDDWETRLSNFVQNIASTNLTSNVKRAVFDATAQYLNESVKQSIWRNSPKIIDVDPLQYSLQEHSKTFANMGDVTVKIWQDYAESAVRTTDVTRTLMPFLGEMSLGLYAGYETYNTIQSAMDEYSVRFSKVIDTNKMAGIIRAVNNCNVGDKCFGSTLSNTRWFRRTNDLDNVSWWLPPETVNELDVIDTWVDRFAAYGDGSVNLPINDDDSDGVPNAQDLCPGTANSASVDDKGCTIKSNTTDSDNDGVTDYYDLCQGTPAGLNVNTAGCLATSTQQPNLSPYFPSSSSGANFAQPWSDSIVISNVTGTFEDVPVSNTDNIYIDFAIANIGATATSASYRSTLSIYSLDQSNTRSIYKTITGTSNPTQNVNNYIYWPDLFAEQLPAGNYVAELVVDIDNSINESYENDNTYSKEFTVQASTNIIINAPTGVTAQAGDGSITVSWNPATNASSYDIVIAAESGVTLGNYSQLANGALLQNQTSPAIISALNNGTTYYVKVIARNNTVFSLGSAEASATPAATVITWNNNGTYNVTVTPTTATDINGNACGSAAGTITLSSDTVTGSVVDTFNRTFDISGSIDNSGNISGGFAYTGTNTASYTGQFSNKVGSGTWTDIYQCSGTWSAAVNLGGSGSGKLNDTGITWGGNYSSGNNTTCIGETIAEQDCSKGRDAQAAAGTLSKVGGGQAGFDFTKLDANGNALAASATSWSCVRDNHTGLVWEVKTTDGGIHDASNTYRWGGKTALLTGTFGTQYNDWDTLVDGSNAGSGLCGFTDWRVPAREELRSIVNYNQANPAIDTAYFPNIGSDAYWSASPNANYSSYAWGVYFRNGYGSDDSISRGYTRRVRLVRGGQ